MRPNVGVQPPPKAVGWNNGLAVTLACWLTPVLRGSVWKQVLKSGWPMLGIDNLGLTPWLDEYRADPLPHLTDSKRAPVSPISDDDTLGERELKLDFGCAKACMCVLQRKPNMRHTLY
jgi:hypothetical protein